MTPPEKRTPTSPSGTTSWHPVLPGIGLTFGAGLGLLVALLLSTAPIALVIGVAVGAGLGLLVGAVARGLVDTPSSAP